MTVHLILSGRCIQPKQLDGEINKLMEMNKNRYEDFVMGIADKEDLQQCRDEREALQAELQDINSRIAVLDRKRQHYQLFCDALADKQKIGQLVTSYLQNVTVFSSGQVDIQLMS